MAMRMIPTRIHGVLDYLFGIVLILSPWLFHFGVGRNGSAVWLPVALGIVVIVYSLGTRYELGLMPGLEMTTHLILDVVAGVILIVSPWVLRFDDRVWLPHVAMGAIAVVVALLTQTVPHHVPRPPRASPFVEP
jgi:hypothetical protein